MPGRRSNASSDIVFFAKDIPPLAATNYYVQTSTDNKPGLKLQPISSDADFILDNGVSTANKSATILKIHTLSFYKNG